MATSDTSSTLETVVYIAMGLSSDDLSEDIVDYYLDAWEDVYSAEWQIVHNTIISCYKYLIHQAAVESSGGGTRDEINGPRRITVSGYDKSSDWQDALDDYLDAPWQVLPQYKSYFKKYASSPVKIIGVNRDKVVANQRNKNAYGIYSEKSPFETSGNNFPVIDLHNLYKDL